MHNHGSKDSNENDKSSVSLKMAIRMVIGGIVGASVFLALSWFYVTVIRSSPAHVNPIAILGSIGMAWFGFILGAILNLFSRKWPK
ncbi:MAG: hypothetical protein AB9866_16465 [Syntrophobacteraceae bacterium]